MRHFCVAVQKIAFKRFHDGSERMKQTFLKGESDWLRITTEGLMLVVVIK